MLEIKPNYSLRILTKEVNIGGVLFNLVDASEALHRVNECRHRNSHLIIYYNVSTDTIIEITTHNTQVPSKESTPTCWTYGCKKGESFSTICFTRQRCPNTKRERLSPNIFALSSFK